MATDVLSHIPDPKTGAKKGAPPPEGPPPAHLNVPSAIWKHKATEGGTKQDLKWSELKPGLLEEFGSTKAEYSLKEKLELLQSVGKGAYEDSQAYLIRIRCVVSLLTQNKVPATHGGVALGVRPLGQTHLPLRIGRDRTEPGDRRIRCKDLRRAVQSLGPSRSQDDQASGRRHGQRRRRRGCRHAAGDGGDRNGAIDEGDGDAGVRTQAEAEKLRRHVG